MIVGIGPAPGWETDCLLTRILHFFNYHLATLFGVGHSPVAPGTVASMVTVVLAAFLYPVGLAAQVFLIVAVIALAVATSHWTAAGLDSSDPSEVVIDEVAGQWLTFFLLPVHAFGWQGLAAGFFLFRIFDIWKPGPVRKAEGLPGGWGITCDDLAAGLLANALLQVWFRVLQ